MENGMDEEWLSAEKRRIRREMLRRRDALTEKERERAAVLLAERILGHQWFCGSDVLLAFASCGSEIDTGEILREALKQGKRVYLPRVLSGGGENRTGKPEMVFYRIEGPQDLRSGYRGILEPFGGEEYRYRPEEAGRALMLMPGVAFDRFRRRIGYGGGFYDRYLADKEELRLRTVGVGFQCQMVERLPGGERDIRPYQVICVRGCCGTDESA